MNRDHYGTGGLVKIHTSNEKRIEGRRTRRRG